MLLPFFVSLYLQYTNTPLLQSDFFSYQQQIIQNYNEYLFLHQPRDTTTDSSLQKYVSPEVGMQQLSYRPDDLVSLSGLSGIQVDNAEYKIRNIALGDLLTLAGDFQKTFGKPLKIVSSYRSYSYQKDLFAGYAKKYGSGYATTISAKPGFSEHQLGLAIDIFNASTADDFKRQYGSYADRMQKNAYKYGRTQSYQKGKDIDGYIIEPRHYRYVGKELATYLQKKGITFGEFVKMIYFVNK